MKWQFYPKFQVGLSKFQDTFQDYAWFEYVLCVGYLQFRWKGKPWCTHLRRSPKYIAKVKQQLLEELQSAKYTPTNP